MRHFWFEWEHVELEQKLKTASPKQQQHKRTQQCWQEKAYLWSQQAVSWAHSYLRVWSLMDTSSHLEAFMLWNLPAETNTFWIIYIFWQKTHKQTNKKNPTIFSPDHKLRLIWSITLALQTVTLYFHTQDRHLFLLLTPNSKDDSLIMHHKRGGEQLSFFFRHEFQLLQDSWQF